MDNKFATYKKMKTKFSTLFGLPTATDVKLMSLLFLVLGPVLSKGAKLNKNLISENIT